MSVALVEAPTEAPKVAKPKGTCPWQGCTHPTPQPPYRYLRDGVPSVTAISGIVDLGKSSSFGYAASLICATTAVHEPERWAHLSSEGCDHSKEGLCAACAFLRGEHAAQWDQKRDFGSHVHHLAESWAKGETIDCTEASQGHMDAIERFYLERRPTWHAVECTVGYHRSGPKVAYRGKFDGLCEIDCQVHKARRCTVLLDYKSKDRLYAAEQTLQLAGYRFATLTRWEDKTEHIIGPVPKVAHAGVLLLNADGTYRLVDLPANRDAHRAFLRLRRAYDFHRAMTRWEREQEKAA